MKVVSFPYAIRRTRSCSRRSARRCCSPLSVNSPRASLSLSGPASWPSKITAQLYVAVPLLRALCPIAPFARHGCRQATVPLSHQYPIRRHGR